MDQSANTQIFIVLFQWIAALSLAAFILSLIIIPLIISKLSIDCFININKKKEPAGLSGTSVAFLLLRNIGGIFFLTAGFAMLFLPGQGLLTILLGLLLLTFPGKQTMINFLIAKPSLQHSLDWIRKKSGKPPFIWP